MTIEWLCCVLYLLASEASLSLVMSIEIEIFFIYIFIYVRQHLSCGFTAKRKDGSKKVTMPDECNVDSITYVLKLESRVPFRGVDSIIISCREE